MEPLEAAGVRHDRVPLFLTEVFFGQKGKGSVTGRAQRAKGKP